MTDDKKEFENSEIETSAPVDQLMELIGADSIRTNWSQMSQSARHEAFFNKWQLILSC